ncbi:MAG: DUF4469 domain-containing protein, partial [Spirochaetaceae bacterium]|nr:DUF4469 domain-containing protein [Spirochaetaceae bacterium]
LFNAYPSISGTFDSPETSFDPAHHKVHINLHPGIVLRTAVSSVKTKKVAAVVSGTVITAVTDLKSGAINTALTPGRDVKLSGLKLKVAGEEADVGLYFVPESGGAAIKVDPSDIIVNNPAELIAVIPALAAGIYRVKIVTQYSNSGKLLKSPRSFTFEKGLTVS